jgi:hypothetical protein
LQKLLEMCDTAMHGVGGTCNNWAAPVELQLMKLDGFEYSGKYIDLPKGKEKQDRSHICGSIRKLII